MIVLLVLIGMTTTNMAQEAVLKPRLVVCTDIAPADVEPDDMESMVRLMAYADMFEIEALITSVGWNCDPYPKEWAQYLHRVIDAYAQDVKNLMKRSKQKKFLPLKKENGRQPIGYWPSAEYIRGRAMMGSEHGGIRVVGEGNDSPGSELLIRLADEDDSRPIYVAAWGGANTLAQAIWRVKQTRTAEELKRFVRKFRIYTITDQDMQYSMRMNRAYSSHQWLRREFQDDLQFIWDEGTWQEQCELGKQHWAQHQQNIQGKGALGKEYPNYKWGVEGDTPSFLYVMPNGLNDPEDPSQAGWAGYHERGICPDSLTTAWTSWQEPVRSISVGYKRRFYTDELNDFMARMKWADEGAGNHNPIVVIHGHEGPSPLVIKANAGDTILLDASKSWDPDGDDIQFLWWQQPEIGTAKLAIDDPEKAVTTIHVPADAAGQALHLICEVHDSAPFHLAAYQRIIVVVEHIRIVQPRISIFFDHVGDIARQEKISITEAASRVRQLGIEGIDVRVSIPESQLRMLDSLGFEHACAIADINFVKGEQPEAVRQALDFMHRHHYSRLLVIPGLLPENASPELADTVCEQIVAFVKEAAQEGVDVMVEDYDNPRSPCYNTATLDHLFAASPQLNHVFDTGNYLFCGEEVMAALHHFRERIHHVHLKDRKAKHDYASLPIGMGIVPLKDVVGELMRSGYDGWFTVEHFGAPSMWEYATQSVANIKATNIILAPK